MAERSCQERTPQRCEKTAQSKTVRLFLDCTLAAAPAVQYYLFENSSSGLRAPLRFKFHTLLLDYRT